MDLQNLKQLFDNRLPENPKEQNKVWYRLYLKYKDNVIIGEVQRNYLITRDFTVFTAILIPLTLASHIIITTDLKRILMHLTFLLILFFVLSISSRNYGKRFVADVIVKASHEKEEE